MITHNYEVKLIDMGMFSSLVGTAKTGFYASKKGTPQYMCPEVHKGMPYQGSDADLFATFVALFIMRVFRYPFQAAISKGGNADYNYYCLQRSDTKEYWEMFDETPSTEFKRIIEVMLQEDPNARLTMVDVIGHEWMVQPTASAEQFKEKYQSIIGN